MSPHDNPMQVQRGRGDIAQLATSAIKAVHGHQHTKCHFHKKRYGTRGVLLSAVYYSVKTSLTLTIQAFLDLTLSQILKLADFSVERYVSFFRAKQYN
jgi:hypothetical protein